MFKSLCKHTMGIGPFVSALLFVLQYGITFFMLTAHLLGLQLQLVSLWSAEDIGTIIGWISITDTESPQRIKPTDFGGPLT